MQYQQSIFPITPGNVKPLASMIYFSPSLLKDSMFACRNTSRTVAKITGRGIMDALRTTASLFDAINPVSIAIRRGTKAIRLPLQYLRDKTNTLTFFTLHPITALCYTCHFICKSPARVSRLLMAVGIPVDPTTLLILAYETDLKRASDDFHNILKNNDKPVGRYPIQMDMAQTKGVQKLMRSFSSQLVTSSLKLYTNTSQNY